MDGMHAYPTLCWYIHLPICLSHTHIKVGYESAHPCPKCEGMLRAVGVREVRHTCAAACGTVGRTLGPPLPHLLSVRDGVCSPLRINLHEEFGMRCERLEVDVYGAGDMSDASIQAKRQKRRKT